MASGDANYSDLQDSFENERFLVRQKESAPSQQEPDRPSCPVPETQTSDMTRIFEMMVMENRRRDQLIERLLDRITPTPSQSTPQNTGCTNLSIMPEVLRSVGIFNGNRSEAKPWLETLISVQTLHQIPDNYMLETARTRLQDGAKFWYDAKRNEITDWNSFVSVFQLSFYPRSNMMSKLRDLDLCTQKKDELVATYFYKKLHRF